MKNVLPYFYSTLFFVLTGCATPSTGIVKITDDTYMHSRMGGMFTYTAGEVKAGLYKEANDFCAQQGKKVQPLNSSGSDADWAKYASGEIQFKCV